MNRSTLAFVLAACVAAAGCDSADPNDSASSQTGSPSKAKTTEPADSTAALERAVRTAVRQNNKVSQYVLWHNRVPASAQRSTQGRALETMRESAADRREGRLQVRTLSVRVDIADIRLDPSFTRATASVRQRGRVRLYRNGRRLRRPLPLDEQARFHLRRVGDEPRFIVWEVTEQQ
jgi:hypothetical protein